VKLAVWSPLPPSPSGIADYVAETLPVLREHADVEVVVEDPEAVTPIDGVALRRPDACSADALPLYQLGNSPAHAYVYRAALARPGVSVLHDWSLHHLVLCETVERGDVTGYLREMRRGYGETGTFVGRQVARALGGTLLPALFPLNDRILEGSLGIVGLTRFVSARARCRAPERSVLHLPHHLALPLDPPPTREAARAALGLPADALLVTCPGLATVSKRLPVVLRVVARLRRLHPRLRLVIAGGVDADLPLPAWADQAGIGDGLVVSGRQTLADFERHLAAADVVCLLRFPSHGEMSGALVRALGVGRPCLVTAGTPAADEFPEGVVVPVDPGRHEEAELEALLLRLLDEPALGERIGRLAAAHVRTHHDLRATIGRLLAFLEQVQGRAPALLRLLDADRALAGTLAGYFAEEVRWAARDLGLAGIDLGVGPLLRDLARPA